VSRAPRLSPSPTGFGSSDGDEGIALAGCVPACWKTYPDFPAEPRASGQFLTPTTSRNAYKCTVICPPMRLPEPGAMNPKKGWDLGTSVGGYLSPTTPRAPFARAKTQLAARPQKGLLRSLRFSRFPGFGREKLEEYLFFIPLRGGIGSRETVRQGIISLMLAANASKRCSAGAPKTSNQRTSPR
jgi:hypothetical protein